MTTHTNVPIRADRPYTKALKALAYQQDMTVGELVRSAVDKVYGEELKPHLKNFASDGQRTIHSDTEVTSRDGLGITHDH